jgi:hypothetical protein
MTKQKTTYHGNVFLKPIGILQEFTDEQQLEYLKCTEDYIYFIEKYCKIVSLDHGLVEFKLWEFQKEVLHAIHENRMFVLMMPRQQSKTSLAAAYILWYTLFQESKTVAILANKKATSLEVMDRYQIMYENLPIWLQQGVRSFNKGDVELENGSKVFTAATTLSGIRGKAVNFLYIDEAAIIPNNIANDFFASVYPTISSGNTTKLLVTSTPMGYNHFWHMWQQAEPGKEVNGFKRMFVEYWKHPHRNEKWAADQKALLGELRFNQEVLCEFLGSSKTLIAGRKLAEMASKDPESFAHSDMLAVYQRPEKDHIYAMIVDTSEGIGGDYNAFSIIDITTVPYQMVAMYRNNNISPLLFPDIIFQTAKVYNEAFVLIELDRGTGRQVADILHFELEYENIVVTATENSKTFMTPGYNVSTVPGVKINKAVKRTGCLALKTLVEENKLLIFDKDAIFELSTFIETKGSFAADVGYHDDIAMTLVLFGWMTTNQYFQELTDVNLRKRIFEERMKQAEDEMLPFVVIDDGVPQPEQWRDGNIIWSTDPNYNKGFFGETGWEQE